MNQTKYIMIDINWVGLIIPHLCQRDTKWYRCRGTFSFAYGYLHGNEYIALTRFKFPLMLARQSHFIYICNLIAASNWYLWTDTISYPLFADADTGIYPHAASRYHARPKAKRGIAMLSVDKFSYPRKQTRGNEFIPCSNNICDILKRFRSFKIPAITLIWPKSSYKHSVTRSYRSGKESGRRSESPLWRNQ